MGLGPRELADLLDRFEQPDQDNTKIKRDFVRRAFRQTSVKVQVFHPGGISTKITVACRNLSRAGMAILHSSFVHTGTKVRIHLPHPTRGEQTVDGWVTRCTHRTGVVHEVGIRFEQHLDVREILRPSLFTDWFSLERVNPEDLEGTVLSVDASDVERRIVKHFLRGTRLKLIQVSSAAEALSCLDDSVDLVMTDFHLGDMTGAELASRIRENGMEVPIIILTCDTQSATADVLASAKASAFLAKPTNQDLLLRAIAEFLIVRKPEGPATAGGPGGKDAGNPALTESLIAALGQYAKRLEDCVIRHDAEAARTICLQVAGAAGAIGFKEVAQLAAKAADAILRNRSTSESISALRSVVAACQRTGNRPSKVPTNRPSVA